MRKSIKGGYQTSRSSKKTTRRRRKSRSSKSLTKYVGGTHYGESGFRCRSSNPRCNTGLECTWRDPEHSFCHPQKNAQVQSQTDVPTVVPTVTASNRDTYTAAIMPVKKK